MLPDTTGLQYLSLLELIGTLLSGTAASNCWCLVTQRTLQPLFVPVIYAEISFRLEQCDRVVHTCLL